MTSRRGWWVVVAAGLVPACGLLAPASAPAAHPLAFDHDAHVRGANLACAECHATAATGVEAGLPPLATCTDCHEDEEEPSIRTFLEGVAARPEGARWVTYAHVQDDLIFSHSAHAAKGVECAACHGDVAGSEATGRWVATRMSACVDCHEARAPERTACASCHTDVRADRAPASHVGRFADEHGELARAGDLLDGSCRYCHGQDECMACHVQVAPRSHTTYFTSRGHGWEAATDRQACAACHEQDACVRCHQQTRPANHGGAWGGLRSNHCDSCHVPVAASDCATCHQGTPSHATATSLPASHTAGMDCRQCHGLSQPLPHVDNGMECSSCHR